MGRRFADVLRIIDDFELASAWHSHRGEEHGKESEATLYWTWNQEKKFHIDFVFGSRSLAVRNVSVGTFSDYVGAGISDHVPLVVDYAASAGCLI